MAAQLPIRDPKTDRRAAADPLGDRSKRARAAPPRIVRLFFSRLCCIARRQILASIQPRTSPVKFARSSPVLSLPDRGPRSSPAAAPCSPCWRAYAAGRAALDSPLLPITKKGTIFWPRFSQKCSTFLRIWDTIYQHFL